MGLRTYINSRDCVKKINCSGLGGKFERSDFARSVEEAAQDMGGALKDDVFFERLTGMFGTLLFPIPSLVIYGLYKYDKSRGHPSYLLFSNDHANILNRCNLR